MDQNIPYQYKANDKASYVKLASYLMTTEATVTLHPTLLTIVVSDGDADDVALYIDAEALDFQINFIKAHDENRGDVIDCPTTDAGTLRGIIYDMFDRDRQMTAHHRSELESLRQNLDSVTKDRDIYRRWWEDATGRLNEARKRFDAIGVLMDSVFATV